MLSDMAWRLEAAGLLSRVTWVRIPERHARDASATGSLSEVVGMATMKSESGRWGDPPGIDEPQQWKAAQTARKVQMSCADLALWLHEYRATGLKGPMV